MSSELQQRRDLMVVDSDPAPAVAPRTPTPIALNWTREDLDALKATIGANLTDAEFKVFIAGAKHLGLDPSIRQVVPIKQGGRVTLQITIDGFRLISERSGKYAGMLGPYWCGADGVWHDVWLADKPPVAAKVGILRRDFAEPIWGVARFKSYDKGSGTWQQYPDAMIAKVAESIARRIAFPYELSGAYGEDELGAPPPPPSSSLPTGETKRTVTVTATATTTPATEIPPPAPQLVGEVGAFVTLHQRATKLGMSEQRWTEAKEHFKGDTAGIANWLKRIAETRRAKQQEDEFDPEAAAADDEPAPSAGWGDADEPHVADEPDEPAATERQWASIRKLCQALQRSEPDGPLSYNDARELVSALSQAYQHERRKASAAVESAEAGESGEALLDAVMADVELRRRLTALGYATMQQVEEFVADARRRGAQSLDDALAVLGQIEAEAQRAAANAPSLQGLGAGQAVRP